MYRNTNHTPCGGAPEAAIIALERRAPERWNQGDPDGFLELTSGDVVYFDPALGRKLIGKKALGEYYGTVRGKVRIDTYRMIDPVVRLSPGAAVLAYDYEVLRDGQVFQDALHGSLHDRNVRRLGDRTYALVFRPAGRLRRCGVAEYSPCGVWNANCTARGMEKKNR